MTNSASLRALAATPYLDRARDAAFRGRFGEAEQHLGNARRLNPAGYEASLLTAKIRLREGRLEECREALLEARRLGHPVSESEQMLAWLDAHGKSRMGDPRGTPSGDAAAREGVPRGSPMRLFP